MEKKLIPGIKTLMSVSFLLMIVVNVLANVLPLGGRTTGAISDHYANLFAPAGYTFAIWGLIYLLCAVHVLYQLGIFRGRGAGSNEKLLRQVAILFSVTSLANTAWIFFWHYDNIPMAMAMTGTMLVMLIAIMALTRRQSLAAREKLLIRLPFSAYFGWITVATIANATVLLVALGWDRWGLSESFWTVVVLIAGVLIGAAWIHRAKDLAYGLVLIWAYAGILVKHLYRLFRKVSGRHRRDHRLHRGADRRHRLRGSCRKAKAQGHPMSACPCKAKRAASCRSSLTSMHRFSYAIRPKI